MVEVAANRTCGTSNEVAGKKKSMKFTLSTIEIIKATVKADPQATPADRANLLAFLRNGGNVETTPAAPAENRLLRRVEAARLLGRSARTVDELAQQGILFKVKLPGRKRAAGFRYTDVVALIA